MCTIELIYRNLLTLGSAPVRVRKRVEEKRYPLKKTFQSYLNEEEILPSQTKKNLSEMYTGRNWKNKTAARLGISRIIDFPVGAYAKTPFSIIKEIPQTNGGTKQVLWINTSLQELCGSKICPHSRDLVAV